MEWISTGKSKSTVVGRVRQNSIEVWGKSLLFLCCGKSCAVVYLKANAKRESTPVCM